ncbi:putative LRR receptor-like serine/threonine-protein kinase, partial [Dissostichus eleginoides]
FDSRAAQHPRTPTEKEFPHDASAITKVQLNAKQIRSKGLGGSPATRTLSSGIETGDLEESSSGPSSSPSLERSNDSPQPESSESSESLPAAVVKHRRDLLQIDGLVKNHLQAYLGYSKWYLKNHQQSETEQVAVKRRKEAEDNGYVSFAAPADVEN